jgi:hypothetical protein
MPSEFTTQINPRVPLEIKAQIDALCKERGVLVGEVVTTALRQYFGLLETEGDRLTDIQAQGSQILAALHALMEKVDALGGTVEAVTPPQPAAPTDWTEDGRVMAAPQRRGWWGRS